jgi:hypothetical protein
MVVSVDCEASADLCRSFNVQVKKKVKVPPQKTKKPNNADLYWSHFNVLV